LVFKGGFLLVHRLSGYQPHEAGREQPSPPPVSH
jgi:hypothetical protein